MSSNHELKEVTITELQQMYKDGLITVREVVKEYIHRIKNIDQGENGLGSVLEINPESLEIADRLDGQGYDEQQLLYGVPVLIKDNIDTADRMHTSAGSLALADSIALEDAELIKALRAQGAVILGKTNMTEFANYMTEHMPNGYSSRGGLVLNPYDRQKDPSGSSSGSGAAVAADLCVASIGSDTCNSILGPGSAHGVVGFRPSTGAISQQGIIPISFTLDTAGPFTRTVEDAALMYAALTGKPVVRDSMESIKGKVIGYNTWEAKDREDRLPWADEAVRELEKAGAIIERFELPETPYVNDLMKYEFKYAMNKYLAGLPKDYPIKTLKDIIEFNKKEPTKTLRYGQILLEDAQENTTGNLDEALYLDILKDRKEKMRQLRELFQGMDFCILYSFNNILQYTALPGITIPYGLQENGLPAVLQLAALTDEKLLENAYIVERTIGKRIGPRLKK